MKKRDILKMLEPFEDSDSISFDGVIFLSSPEKICGKGQWGMPYICVLEPDHEGDCWCGCKKVDFEPQPAKCECGCKQFVWWIEEQGCFSSPTDAEYYERERHPRAVCYKCSKSWEG